MDDWNEYVIEADRQPREDVDQRQTRAWIMDDPKMSQRGIFGLQIHAGGPMEVRFKDIKLEVLTPKK